MSIATISNTSPMQNLHPMVTRSKLGIFKPKICLTHTEPDNLQEALTSPVWLVAMREEYNALLNNKTWRLVHLPSNISAIGCK